MTGATGAWVRAEDNTYGHDKFPFGLCSEDGCDSAACHLAPAKDDGAQRRVCRAHLPDSIFFSPFLGQQTKLFMARERWVLGGGGAGGAKTYAGSRLWLKQWNAEQRRYLEARERGEDFQSKGWALFLRRTFPELLQVIEDFKKYIRKVDPGARWDQQQKLATLTNGYKVQFGGMEDDDGYLKYYGGEYTLVVIDEATQFTKKQIQEIDARIRCGDPVLDEQCQLYLLTNPVGGATKKWLKRRFVRVAAPEAPVKVKVKLLDGRELVQWQVYIPCNLYDNPALMATGKYEANLMLKASAMRRALLLNDWDVDEGSWVGDAWDPAVHICKPFVIPKNYPRFKFGDYGRRTKSAVGWAAIDNDGNWIVYRWLNTIGLTARDLAMRIKEIESRPLVVKFRDTGKRIEIVGPEWDEATECSTVLGPMDSSLWNKQGEDGESRGEILENLGTGFYRAGKGKKFRHDAADQILHLLRRRTAKENGKDVPGIRFFEGTTEPTLHDDDGHPEKTGPIHTIPVLPFDPNDPDVPDTDADDHDWDALAYGAMSRQVPGSEEVAEVIDFLSVRNKEAIAPTPIAW